MPTYQNTLIALRGALWRMIDSIDPANGSALHGWLVCRAQQQGYTTEQAHEALDAIVEAGHAEYSIDPFHRVVVRPVHKGGRA